MNAIVKPSAVVHVDEANFAAQVEQATMPVFVDFWSPSCGPCRALAPLFEKLAEAYGSQIRFAKVNTDDNRELARRLDIRSLPTLLMFRDGKVIEQTIGAQSKAHFTNLLDKYVREPVTMPAPESKPARRSFQAFYGDAGLRDAVVARVRAHIGADEIVSNNDGGPRCEPDKRQYSLMGAALDSADQVRYEGTLGLPAHVGRLAEAVHSMLMQEVEVDGKVQYHFRPPYDDAPIEWLRAIPLGADLHALTPAFLDWFLQDLAAGPYLYGVEVIPEVRAAMQRTAGLHARAARGDAPSQDEWKQARSDLGALLAGLGERKDLNLFSQLAMRVVEMLAWPVDELEDAPGSAIGVVFYVLWQASIRAGYSAGDWAEREAVAAAAVARHNAEPDATPQQLEAFAEVKAHRAMIQRCQPIDDAQAREAKRVYGERLRQGLLRALAGIAGEPA